MKKYKSVLLASDHNGVGFKKILKKFLAENQYRCIDIGPFDENIAVNYVDYGFQGARIVAEEDVDCGVLICGTGIGMSIAANKVPNIRAALVHNELSANNSREHNDSNVLCLGSWINTDEENLLLSKIWFNAEFGKGRHIRRVEKLKERVKVQNTLVYTELFEWPLTAEYVEFLKYAKSLGDYLIIGVSSRQFSENKDIKAILNAIEYVDEVMDKEHSKEFSPLVAVYPENKMFEHSFSKDTKIQIFSPMDS